MDIKRSGSRSSREGPTDWFTGKVRVEPLFQASAPGRVQGASVTFEPGARSAWHTHPLGQTLIVTAGRGFVQSWGGSSERFILAMLAPGRRERSICTAPRQAGR